VSSDAVLCSSLRVCSMNKRHLPITIYAPSEAWTVFARSKTGIVGSNPTRGMDICVVLCVGSGVATGYGLTPCIVEGSWQSFGETFYFQLLCCWCTQHIYFSGGFLTRKTAVEGNCCFLNWYMTDYSLLAPPNEAAICRIQGSINHKTTPRDLEHI
jgi:hypothetical protein